MATSVQRPRIDRRTFLLASVATAAGISAQARAQAPALETFTQWLNASRSAREGALQACLDRIASMDPSIHAWVQVSPQRPTGNGALSEIPFRREGHHRDARLVHGMGFAGLPRAHRHGRCGDRHRPAAARRDPARKNAHNRLRLSHAGADAKPAQSRAYAGRKLQRLGRRGGGGDGAPFALGTQTEGSGLDRPPIAASRASRRATACSYSKACFRWRRASTPSGSSRIRPRTCWRSGRRPAIRLGRRRT